MDQHPPTPLPTTAVRIAHIGDLHLGAAGTMVEQWVDVLLVDLARRSPDAIVLVGDLTDTGTAEQFEQAWQVLDRMVEQMSVDDTVWSFCLGNRDVLHGMPTIPNRHAPAYLRPIKLNGASGSGIAIDVLESSRIGVRGGALDPAAVAQQLIRGGRDRQTTTIIACHHAPIPIAETLYQGEVVDGAGDVLALLDEFEHAAWLSGHKHVPNVRVLDGHIVLSTCGSPAPARAGRERHATYSMTTISHTGIAVEWINPTGDDGR